MRRISRTCAYVAVCLTALMLMSVGTAAGAGFEVDLEFVADGSITFDEGEAAVLCDVTLALTLADTISESVGAHGGSVTSSEWSCIGVSPPIPITMTGQRAPWELKYASFQGTLPTISALLLRLEAVVLLGRNTLIPIACQFEGSLGLKFEAGLESVEVLTSSRLALTRQLEGSEIARCPGTWPAVGNMAVRPQVGLSGF